MGLKILGRVGTHIFFFWKKNIILWNFEKRNAFQNALNFFFPENLKKF